MNIRITMLLGALLLAACEVPVESHESAIIEAHSQAWERALNDKDLNTLLSLYSRNARVLSPNKEMAAGEQAVRDEFGAMLSAGLSGELTTVEARHAGDIGYHVGLYNLASADGSVVDRGKFIEIWRLEEDGQWRISNDIYNSDLPAAAAAAPPAHTVRTYIHEVDDPQTWIAAWQGTQRRAQFRRHGALHVHAFQDQSDPNTVGLVIALEDPERFDAFLASAEGAEAAAADTVRMETLRSFEELP